MIGLRSHRSEANCCRSIVAVKIGLGCGSWRVKLNGKWEKNIVGSCRNDVAPSGRSASLKNTSVSNYNGIYGLQHGEFQNSSHDYRVFQSDWREAVVGKR